MPENPIPTIKMNSLRAAALFALFLFCAGSMKAERACPDLRTAYRDSDVVFTGTATHTTERDLGFAKAWATEFETAKTLRTNLREGVPTLVWVVHMSTACCFYRFKEGTDYLILASVHYDTGVLETDQCRAFLLSEARDKLAAIQRSGSWWRHFP